MDDILKDFLLESYENLDRLDQDFVALETNPNAFDKLSSIFRTIHTIKGTCGCLGLNKLESVTHVGENILSRLRDGHLTIDADITTGLLKMVDAVRAILRQIEQTGREGENTYDDVRAELVRLNERPSLSTAPNAHEPVLPVGNIDAPVAASAAPASPTSIVVPKPASTVVAPAEAPVAETKAVATDTKAVAESADAGAREGLAGNAIRVDVTLLDRLMTLVGELVLTRNQVLQHRGARDDTAFVRTAQRLNLITSELQAGVMKTRMQPIGNLWSKFPRIVRDVSAGCGKKVRIEMEGNETELDKTILEAIKDPLTHILRNSIDHGVEGPAQRATAGKPAEGVVRLRAFHEGGQVNIEVSDDGKGIDAVMLKRKAVEKGVITADQAGKLSERDAIRLIFAPGFSTAEKVTNVSGRGVGMDVVRTNVEKIGGTVDVQTVVGKGTSLRIRIPLTLAILPALLVNSGEERFAIPQVNLVELVRLDDKSRGVEFVDGTPLYRLRGNLLPLVPLNKALELNDKALAGGNIVVLRAGETQFGLVVDSVKDTEEIVVKPLGKTLAKLTTYAGAAILGDGKIALILDVVGIAQRAGLSLSRDEKSGDVEAADTATTRALQSLLLFSLPGDRRMALPLNAVARLEEFAFDRIETIADRAFVQYRDRIMPIVHVADVIAAPPRNRGELQPDQPVKVIVCGDGEGMFGLRVENIDDVIDADLTPQAGGARRGVVGTIVVKGRVTEVLDLNAAARFAGEIGASAANKEQLVEAA